MRLWHYKLIPFLPKSQLLGQWRELNSIFKKQDKHILINYVYEYEKIDLIHYTFLVLNEMSNRHYKANLTNFYNRFSGYDDSIAEDIVEYCEDLKNYESEIKPFANHHNKEYLTICYWNLREKYIRGQKDFTKDAWDQIEKLYMEENQ